MRTLTTKLACAAAIWGSVAFAQPHHHSKPNIPVHQPRISQAASLAAPAQASSVPQVAAPVQPSPAAEGTAPAQPSPATAPASPPNRSSPPYSPDVLYNLANSYARAGKPGLAVLNYKRAALLAPNDPDINANLDYVRATAHVASEPQTRFMRIAQLVSPTQAAWLGVLGIAVLGAILLANKVTRRYRGVRTTGTLVGIALISLTVCNGTLLWPRMHEGVILINQTPARVAPVPMGDTAFQLGEAETVTISAEHEDFILIRTRAGRTGWVARANLGAVVP